MMMNKRRSFLTGLLGLGGLSSVKVAAASDGRGRGLQLFFAYRDVVTKFSPAGQNSNLVTFAGADLGTVEGVLSGTIIQSFTVTVDTVTGAASTGPDKALFTDLDRDQITFQYTGTGNFLPPNGLMSAGGSLSVTYSVLDASGKYKFLIGRQFPAQVIATNAVNGSGGTLGCVYGEVYASDVQSIEKAL
jgi:hypothetical protein